MQFQPGFFDLAARGAKLTQMGDPLVGLNEKIDWEVFRSELNRVHEKTEPRKSNAGAKPIDVVLMFKLLVLQQLHNLSDERLEYQVRDRLSFMRFLGLQMESRVPDEKTVWAFRERMKELGLVDTVFAAFHQQLASHGYVAQSGQMIDATFVEVPKQRNNREENALIKDDAVPLSWADSAAKRAQKDTDARWTRKNEEKHFGYKNHVNVDAKNKLIHAYGVTDASVHDSNVFDELLDHSVDEQGKKRSAFADSAYRSAAQEARLAEANIASEIHEKGVRGKPLTEEQKMSNTQKSKTRARVEHVFGAQAQMGGHIVRTIGKARAKVKIGMMNLVYNMRRLVQLLKRDAGTIGTVTPVMQ